MTQIPAHLSVTRLRERYAEMCQSVAGASVADESLRRFDLVLALHDAELVERTRAQLLDELGLHEEFGIEEATLVGGPFDKPVQPMSRAAALRVMAARAENVRRGFAHLEGGARIVRRLVPGWQPLDPTAQD